MNKRKYKGRKPYKKLSGDERKYAFGRLRFLSGVIADHEELARILKIEGVKKGNGRAPNAAWVRERLRDWQEYPHRLEKIRSINIPRASPQTTTRSVVPARAQLSLDVRPQPEPQVTKSPSRPTPAIPALVFAILRDECLSSDQKIEMLLSYASRA